MLALFGAKDCVALEARLVRGEGPLARRLRRLAATLPFGEPPRLEPMRILVDRRLANVNLRCLRIAGPDGATWLFASVPALGVASDGPSARDADHRASRPEEQSPDLREKPAPQLTNAAPPNSRFLWTLDEAGRFGTVHPVLVAAVGANAPERGESVEALFSRIGLDRGEELSHVLGERQTFSGLILEWPLSERDRRRLIALSAAPMFGRHREFLGYRGFGVLGEEIETVAVSEGRVSAELDDHDRSTSPETFELKPSSPTSELEAKVQAHDSVARPVAPDAEFAPTDGPHALQSLLEADGTGMAPTPTKPLDPTSSWPMDETEANVHGRESPEGPVEPTLRAPANVCSGRPTARGGGSRDRSWPHRGEQLDRARSGGCTTGSHRAPLGERASAAIA